MKTLKIIFMSALVGLTAIGEETIVELTTSKDTFGRSNERNANSGTTPLLLLAPVPGVTTLIGFDLTTVTNENTSAEFSFRIQEDNRTPLTISIASMAHNEKNGKWVEGQGNLGIRGQNAQIGEATFQWRAFRDRAWLSGENKNVRNLSDSKLWNELTSISSIDWRAGEWITVKMGNAAFLEDIRNHEIKTVTFGIWGTSGNGVYKLDSKESGHPAKLKLTVKPAPDEVAVPSE